VNTGSNRKESWKRFGFRLDRHKTEGYGLFTYFPCPAYRISPYVYPAFSKSPRANLDSVQIRALLRVDKSSRPLVVPYSCKLLPYSLREVSGPGVYLYTPRGSENPVSEPSENPSDLRKEVSGGRGFRRVFGPSAAENLRKPT
jgi:hypothetical protein